MDNKADLEQKDFDLEEVLVEAYKERTRSYMEEWREHISEIDEIGVLNKFQDYVLGEDRDSKERDEMGVDYFNFIMTPIGLPSPFRRVGEEKVEINEEEVKRKYMDFCRVADKDLEGMNVGDVSRMIMMLVKGYEKSKTLERMSAGHDKGHFWRDVINASKIYENLLEVAGSKTDLIAGTIAGLLHDTGTALTERYTDGKRAIAHAETGALKFFDQFEDDLPESLVRTIAYGIAAHTNVLKEKEVSSGFIVSPYFDAVWKDENEKLWGLSWSIPRLTDRIDCNGVALMVRNIMSKHDAKNEVGEDLSGTESHPMNLIYNQTLKPIIRSEEEIAKEQGFTVFEHNQRFAKSSDGTTPYSKNDYLFPGYVAMMKEMTDETEVIIKTQPNMELVVDDYLRESTLNSFVRLARKMMCLSETDTLYANVFDKLKQHWKEQVSPNDDYVRRWATILPLMDQMYSHWLETVEESVKSSEVKDIIDHALRQLKV